MVVTLVARLTVLSTFVFLTAMPSGQPKPKGQVSCAFKTGYDAINRGHAGRAQFNGHCETNCIKALHISGPTPMTAAVNVSISVTFFTDNALGGPNDRCASAGAVNWGDGPTEPMPSEKITAGCGIGKTKIAGSDVPSVTMTHRYTTPGRYCLSAQMFGNHKYDGDDSCSYDCVVRADKLITVQ